jgi:transcription factor SFP1
VEHYEQSHVVVLAPSGAPLHPHTPSQTDPASEELVTALERIVPADPAAPTQTIVVTSPPSSPARSPSSSAFPSTHAQRTPLPRVPDAKCVPPALLAGSPMPKGTAAQSVRPRRRGEQQRDRKGCYRCPRPGCTKKYLNPGGLKYHLARGTCTF